MKNLNENETFFFNLYYFYINSNLIERTTVKMQIFLSN